MFIGINTVIRKLLSPSRTDKTNMNRVVIPIKSRYGWRCCCRCSCSTHYTSTFTQIQWIGIARIWQSPNQCTDQQQRTRRILIGINLSPIWIMVIQEYVLMIRWSEAQNKTNSFQWLKFVHYQTIEKSTWS